MSFHRAAIALLVASTALATALPVMAEERGSVTHKYYDGRKKTKYEHVALPRKGALDGMTKESVAKWQLCTKGGGMFKSGGKWVDGGCRYPDGTSWK